MSNGIEKAPKRISAFKELRILLRGICISSWVERKIWSFP